MLQLPEGVQGRSRPEQAPYRRHTLSALAASRSLSRAASRAAAGAGLARTLAIVLRNTRPRTPEAMSTSTSSGPTTFDTVPSTPPPDTLLSPRRSAPLIARRSFCLLYFVRHNGMHNTT